MDDNEAEDPMLLCECGSAWFTGGEVALSKRGRVNGWSGFWRCIECGAPLSL